MSSGISLANINKPLFSPGRVPRADYLSILTRAQRGKPMGFLEVLSDVWVRDSGMTHKGNRDALPSMGEAPHRLS